jgi:hypothetical protein
MSIELNLFFGVMTWPGLIFTAGFGLAMLNSKDEDGFAVNALIFGLCLIWTLVFGFAYALSRRSDKIH